MNRDDFQQLLDLAAKREALRAEWNRRVATAAAGTLAILAGLPPDLPPGEIPRLLLAATWILLGLGILSGLVAAHAPVALQARLTSDFASRLPGLQARRETGQDPLPVIARPAWIYPAASKVMVASVAGAVLCFVVFAVWRTLAA